MIDSRWGRLALLAVLLAGLFGVCVGFGATAVNPPHWVFPGADEIATNPAAYLGERVEVTGTVVERDPIVIQVPYERVVAGTVETGVLEFTVINLQRTVRMGQVLKVYGVLQSQSTIRVLDTVVIPAWHYLYMYLVSFVAGVWVLSRLIRGWTFDWEHFAVKPREQPLSLQQVRARLREEGDR